jgi:hypothetical protein
MTRIENCSKCGKPAAVNTPHIDADNNLFCNRCAYESPVLLLGIQQFTNEAGEYVRDDHATKNHCTISGTHAWTDNGSHAYKLTPEEKILIVKDPEKILDQMIELRSKDRFRCSDCGIEMAKSEVAAYPLFAGVICAKCNIEYGKQIENERKSGHVCRMCRQPYSLCCC